MNDGSGIKKKKGLLKEWSLLLETFQEENQIKQKFLKTVKNKILKSTDLNQRSFDLSQKRKEIYLKIESIKNKIDFLIQRIENRQLVYLKSDDIEQEIQILNHEGDLLSNQLVSIDLESKELRVVVS